MTPNHAGGSVAIPCPSSWGETRGAGLADCWAVYSCDFDQIASEIIGWIGQHAEYGPASASAAAVQQLQASLQRAMSGDWLPLEQHLRRQGAAQARRGKSLHASCAEARLFARSMLPRLVQRHAPEPARLLAALQALNDFSDYCVALVADAHVEQRDAGIRAREQDLATTLDSIGDAVIVTDHEGRIVRMNPVAQRLTGFSLADCQGRPLSEVFVIENEDSGAPVESPVTRVLREGVVVGLANHTVLVARDGARRPIADSGAPVRHENGEIRGVVLVFRDVTEERRAEAALRHWERIFQHATWGVAVASAGEVKFEAVNPAYAEMHGYRVEELVGQPVSKLWAAATRSDMERHAHETRGHGRLIVETTHLCKDGSELPVEVIGTIIKDDSGKAVSFVANVQDIRERRRLQQSQLRAVELEAENRRIEEANRLKSEFLANMSHELRTPLNSIIGFAELLHDQQAGAVTQKQGEFLGEILAGGVHLLRLINDVLDLAKVEAGKMDFHPESVELGSLIGAVVQGLLPSAREKQLQVEVVVDPALDDIVLDPGRFRQLLYNYVSNALKFTPEGGSVVVRAVPEGSDDFRLEVEDTGPGIAAEDVRHLFVPFQQLDSGSTKRHAGTGLGLALTKRLSEAQGGSVGVKPAQRGGSTFFAVLPRRPAGQRRAERRADVPESTAVLVVEEDANDRNLLVGHLQRAGYVVDAVATCADAIVAWRSKAYAALALSLLLSNRDGVQALLSAIRSDNGGVEVPVIALTLVGDDSMAAGFAVTDVLSKPIDPSALLAALERHGAPPPRGGAVLVVDDDPGSLKLMEVTLAKLGYDALCFSGASDALRCLERVNPTAIIVDLLMPNMDGFVFLQQLRAAPERRGIPVMVWTVKDLSAQERRELRAAAQAIVQKGAGGESPLSSALRGFLPARLEQGGRA